MERKEVHSEMNDSRSNSQDSTPGLRRRRDQLDYIARDRGLDANALVAAVARGPEGGDLTSRKTGDVILSKEDISRIWDKLDPTLPHGELIPAIRNELGVFLLEVQARSVADARLEANLRPEASPEPVRRLSPHVEGGRVSDAVAEPSASPRLERGPESGGTKVWARDNATVNVTDNSSHLTVKLSTGPSSVPRERVAELSRLIHAHSGINRVGQGLVAAVESSIVPALEAAPRVSLSPTTWSGK